MKSIWTYPALTTVLAISTALLPQARAQLPGGKGFSPPGTNFGTNPFAGKTPPAGGDGMFEAGNDEDFDPDEDVSDISDEILRQRMEQRLKARGGTPGGLPTSGNAGNSAPGRGGVNVGGTANELGATSLGGGANSKITPGKRNGCLKLDPYTGYGPDIVTNFDFPDADIVEIAKTLGRLTCLNFILDKDVKGRISIVSNAQITVGDAWKAFLTGLDVNGFSLIPSGAYIRIARQRDAKDKQIKTYSGDFSPDNDLYITRVLPLKYISAEEVSRVFRNFMPPNTRIISYDQTNTLIITDTAANIKKIVDMVQLLDVEGYDEGLEVIQIKFASAQDISKLIDQLLPGSQGTGSATPGMPGIPHFGGTRSGFAARKTKEGGVISHIIPDDRTNSVIVSANAKGLEQVKELIRKLDQKITSVQGGSKIHVVYLQFADAEQVATTLNNLASGTGPRPGQPGAITPGIPGGPATSTTASLFEGQIKIAADKATNSLVITGTPTDYQTIARVIAKLDVARDQVYVESAIMELTLGKSFSLGTSIAAPTSGIGFNPNGDFGSFLTNPLSLSGLVMGFTSGKGGTSIPGPSGAITVSNLAGLVHAVQLNSAANVLATPQILTLDNQEATIEIADNIPVPTVTAIQGSTSTGISKEKVGLTLKIKPQINKISNFVKLDIDQKLDDINNTNVPQSLQTSAFGTTSRSSKTTVVVQDGDTVVLGGLVRDKVNEQATKVPLLGDIPVIGWLFRAKTTITDKTNLLVFMNPKIIKQYQSIRRILDKKLRQRDEFLEKNNGGEDPYEDQKLQMVKELPSVDELKSGGRVDNSESQYGDDLPDDTTNQKPQPLSAPAPAPAPLAIPQQPAPLVTPPPPTPTAPPAAALPNGAGQPAEGAAPAAPAQGGQ